MRVTGQMSSRWCGTPPRSAAVSFAVPTSMPWYSCIESALTTSPRSASAIATPRSDLPEAVGPTTAITGTVAGFMLAILLRSPGDSSIPDQTRRSGAEYCHTS